MFLVRSQQYFSFKLRSVAIYSESLHFIFSIYGLSLNIYRVAIDSVDEENLSENINAIVILSPTASLAISLSLLVYMVRVGRLGRAVFGYAMVAYFIAIGGKIVLQSFTSHYTTPSPDFSNTLLGLYYGLQTSFFEIGFAYLFAMIITRRGYNVRYAGGYGISLSFAENGLLLGLFSLIQLVSIYMIIFLGIDPLSNMLSEELRKRNPELFLSTTEILPLVGLSIVERISSILAHYSWGVLVFLAAVMRRPRYFAIAFPMGFIDSLVPFSRIAGLYLVELIVFILALSFLLIAKTIYKSVGG